MNKVDVIKNTNDIEAIKKILRECNPRNYFMFIVGINTGLKVNELLNLKFSNLLDDNYCIRNYITINNTNYFLNEAIASELNNFILKADKLNLLDKYVFESSRGGRPVERCQAYRILNNASKKAGVNLVIGTHTMRKTFGYHFYMTYRDIKPLQRIYNHSSASVTLEYIGIDIEEQNNYVDFSL